MHSGNPHPCGRERTPVVVRDDFVRIADTDAIRQALLEVVRTTPPAPSGS